MAGVVELAPEERLAGPHGVGRVHYNEVIMPVVMGDELRGVGVDRSHARVVEGGAANLGEVCMAEVFGCFRSCRAGRFKTG